MKEEQQQDQTSSVNQYGRTLQLLLSFIKIDNSIVDASGILSKECYVAWLKSKTPKPSDPPIAFKKLIAAHCKGENGIKPFPKNIEYAVLREIRKKQVWSCFSNTTRIIGKRGFGATGFWENKAKNLEKNQSQSLNNLLGIKHSFMSNSLNLEMVKLLSLNLNLQQNRALHDLASAFEAYNNLISSNIEGSKEFANLMEVYTHFYGLENAKLFILTWYKKGGFNAYLSVDLNPPLRLTKKTHYFFSREFVLPTEKFKRFLPGRPIGQCFGDVACCSSLDTDKKLRDIYKGDITNSLAKYLRVFPNQMFLHQDQVLFDFITLGEGWNRTLEYRFDGKIVVLLNRYYLDSRLPNLVFVQIQDITDQFSSIL